MSEYQTFIAASRYARWREEDGRRETWEETVARYVGFWRDRGLIDDKEVLELGRSIHDMEVMPSMRCMMTAGEALDRDNVAGFNCSYLPIDHPRAFDELMYILMCGTGVGFSVERQYIDKLPEVSEEFHETETVIKVADSKIGWAKALRELLSLLYAGQVPSWDVSGVREAGQPLKTFGGRASGPQPLVDLFHFAVDMFKSAAGRRLTDLECHDLCCKIAEVIVVGGVRRSALISLSNPTSNRLRGAKSGQWWVESPHRSLSNNSACYTGKPDFPFFLKEMEALYESQSGERGFFSRTAARNIAARNGRRDEAWDFGTNPCSEIILRPNQFCNLSEVVVRPEDTLATLKEKVRKAAILGTLQATLTDFRYLRAVWKKNTEEEALLGVSLTGIMDHEVLSGRKGDSKKLGEWLRTLRDVAVETNKEWAARLGIAQSVAVTCVKPSGTVSQLVNSASGIHPRFSRYYIRRVRQDDKDPLSKYMVDAGFPYSVDANSPSTLVFDFPIASPDGCITVDETTAMQQLELWKTYQDHWCEHKPSITVYYRDDEFLEVANWIWNNFDVMSGISLLPHTDHVYTQAPYEAIDAKHYKELAKKLPEFDWDELAKYEESDMTKASQELACVGGACEL